MFDKKTIKFPPGKSLSNIKWNMEINWGQETQHYAIYKEGKANTVEKNLKHKALIKLPQETN